MFRRNMTGRLRVCTHWRLSHFFFLNLLTLSCVLPTFSEIVITELQRDPAGSESSLCGGLSHEFVEITNFGPETLFISNLFITDGNESDSIIPCNAANSAHQHCIYGKRLLTPGQTALILDPDYHIAADSLSCTMKIADGTVLWQCGDNEIGNGLASNDGIIIYKGTRTRIDTVIAGAFDGEETLPKPNSGKLVCTVDHTIEGVSVSPLSCLRYPIVYQNNISILSPGTFENLYNGWVLDYFFDTKRQAPGSVICTLMIRPVLTSHLESSTWTVTSTAGSSRIVLASGKVQPQYSTQAVAIELPLDTVQYSLTTGESMRNIDISVLWTPAASLRFNELFPRSIAGTEPEWFEIVNISPMVINIAQWRVGNLENSIVLTSTPHFLKKGAYCIFTSDKDVFRSRYPHVPNVIQPLQWYTLNNNRDTLYLFNQAGVPADTISYNSHDFKDWKNQSLERVDASKSGSVYKNWDSAENSTPGIPNGASSWRNTPSIFIDAGPVPFSPDNDGRDDFYKITCRIPPEQSISISIISFGGKVIKTFKGPSQPEYLWDGRDSRGRLLDNGPFFVIINIDGNKKKSVIRKKGVLWR